MSAQEHIDSEEDPLLPATKGHIMKSYINVTHWLYPETAKHTLYSTREKVRHWLSSKIGHYFVLGLVGLDVAGIVAAFIIDLFKCEKRWGDVGWDEALEALDIISLVFSCLFMLELLASLWAFGAGYFRSKFHVVDSLVVVGGFILDISLHGAIEEAASLIVVLRLWRVFKIIEELSVGAQEQVDHLGEQIENLTKENLTLRDEVKKREEDVLKLKGEIEKVKGVVD